VKKIITLLLAILLPVLGYGLGKNKTPKPRPNKHTHRDLYDIARAKADARDAVGMEEEQRYNEQHASDPKTKGPGVIIATTFECIKTGFGREQMKKITVRIARQLMHKFTKHLNALINKSDRMLLYRCLKKTMREVVVYGLAEKMTFERFQKFIDRTNREIS